MGYYIDFEKISIGDFKEILKGADLLPSRKVLKDNIDHIFKKIQTRQIESVENLKRTLKNKENLLRFAGWTGISQEYLSILIREINSYQQKPNLIRDFPHIPQESVEKLSKAGIKNARQLFSRVLTPENRRDLSNSLGISPALILRLTRLTDLSRIRWVNHTFAFVLLEAGYETAEQVAQADFKELFQRVKQLNSDRRIYKGQIGLNDMKRCVEAAKDVSGEIVF